VVTTKLTPKPSLPAILTDAGNNAAFAAKELFEAKLANEHAGNYVNIAARRASTSCMRPSETDSRRFPFRAARSRARG